MQKQADILLLGKHIFTGTQNTLLSGGVAIKDNRILAVGTESQVLRYAGENTKIISCGEGLILPGLHDDHVHFLSGCLYQEYPSLAAAHSEEEAAQQLRRFYDLHPEKLLEHPWALGFRWYHSWWDEPAYPVKETLDRYFPDVPVCLLNVDAHAVWVNSKALEVCQISAQTPEVPYGKIFRQENGEPTGFFLENAASCIIATAFAFSKETEYQIFARNLPYCSRCGITSVNDMQPFFGIDLGNHAVFDALEQNKKLPVRIHFATDLFAPPEQTKAVSQKYQTGKLVHNGVKGFLDGVIVTHTSIMLDNYTDDPTAPRSFPLSDLQQTRRCVVEAHKQGYSIHLHATGDGAVRFALDCYAEALQTNGATGSRMSVEHCDLTDDADFARFAELGVIASVQPPHIASAESYTQSLYQKTIGKTREKNLWAFRRFLDNGVPLAVGTDFPVVDLNPLQVMYSATDRLFPDQTPQGGFLPEQKLKLEEVLHAYTAGGAYMARRETELGTLAEGKLADITVYDRNLFALQGEELLSAQVALTICDGEIVYRA